MRLPNFTRTAVVAFWLAAALAGCGKLGELERPGPLSATAKSSGDPSHTVNTVDPRDRSNDPAAASPAGGPPDTNSNPQ